MSVTDLKDILKGIIDAKVARAEKRDVWEGSDFQAIRKLQADNRGDVGKNFILDVLREGGYQAVFSSQTAEGGSDYDILVNGNTKLEVKTATLGPSGRTFQHDNIEKDKNYDVLVLVDVAPNDLYMTVAPKNTLPFTHRSVNWTRKPKIMHRRRSGTSYKWFLSLNDVSGRKVKTIDDIIAMFKPVLG